MKSHETGGPTERATVGVCARGVCVCHVRCAPAMAALCSNWSTRSTCVPAAPWPPTPVVDRGSRMRSVGCLARRPMARIASPRCPTINDRKFTCQTQTTPDTIDTRTHRRRSTPTQRQRSSIARGPSNTQHHASHDGEGVGAPPAAGRRVVDSSKWLIVQKAHLLIAIHLHALIGRRPARQLRRARGAPRQRQGP